MEASALVAVAQELVAEVFRDLPWIDARVGEIAQARAHRGGQGPRAQFLGDAERRRLVENLIHDGVVEQGVGDQRARGEAPIFDDRRRERVERVEMHAEKGQAFFDGEQALQAVGERARGRNDQNRRLALPRPQLRDARGEGVLQLLERSGEDLQLPAHAVSLAVTEEKILNYPAQ